MGAEKSLESVYREGVKILEQNSIPDADFDSLYLMEHFFGIDRTALILHGGQAADSDKCEKFFSAVKQRATGKPLQYIVGKWNFMGYDFYVGEGVLIPRDDTEIVVEAAYDYLKNIENPRVIDLCSGSGAIAIAIAKQFPKSRITAVEFSEKAVEFLKKNIILNEVNNIEIVCGDVTKCFADFESESFDLVISNPPYIESEEIDTLQQELQFEPRMALDGGKDGLYFYRIITDKWADRVKYGGMLAYEVGEEQYEPVSLMLKAKGFDSVVYSLDLQGFKRTVSGIRRQH